MKDILLNMVNQTREEAKYLGYHFPDGECESYSHEFLSKEKIHSLLERATDIRLHKVWDSVVMIDDIGVSIKDFGYNVDYPTANVDGYEEHVDKHNSCCKLYIKLDKEHKKISFKLGEKEKTLDLIEHTNFVSKPYYKKALRIVDVDDLEKHIHDEFWNPRMIRIGRKILGYKEFSIAR